MAPLSGVNTIADLVQLLRNEGYSVEKVGGSKGVVLDEKYFRRMDKFEAEVGKWSEWLFNLLICLGQVAPKVEKAVEKVVDGSCVCVSVGDMENVVKEFGEDPPTSPERRAFENFFASPLPPPSQQPASQSADLSRASSV